MNRALVLAVASAIAPIFGPAEAWQQPSGHNTGQVPTQYQGQVLTQYQKTPINDFVNYYHWTIAPDALGASLVPVDEPLRAHLKIEDGVGLAVVAVVPGSPADKILRKNDILLDLEGQPLG